MRVLVWLDDPAEHARRVATEVAEGLAPGARAVAVAAPAGSEALAALRRDGLDAHPLQGPPGGWRAPWRLRRLLRATVADLLVVLTDAAHGTGARALRLAGRGALLRRVTPGARPAVRSGRAREVWCVAGEADRRAVAGAAGRAATAVVPPGVRAPEDRPLVGDQALACLAGPDAATRLPMVLRAVAPMVPRHPALRLRIHGAGDDPAPRLLASAVGLQGAVEWVPATVPRERVLAGAAAAWIATEGDAGCHAALDAWRAGIPVVLPRDGVVHRVFAEGEATVLLDGADPAAAAARLAVLLADADRRAALATAALAAAGRWTFEASGRALRAAAATVVPGATAA